MKYFFAILILLILQVVCGVIPVSAQDKKIYLVIRSEDIAKIDQYLKDPRISGVTFYIGWQKLQKEKFGYDFSSIDLVLAKVTKYNKTLNIGVLPGRWSPEWLTNTTRIQWHSKENYIDKINRDVSSPVPWDINYLGNFAILVNALGRKYNSVPNVGYVAITGPSISNGLETNLVLSLTDFQKIRYSKQKYIDAWKMSIDTFSKSFTNPKLAIALSNQIGPGRSSDEANQISQYAWQKLDGRFVPMLLALSDEDWFNQKDYYVKLALQWTKKTKIGFQMMRIYGNMPQASDRLRKAIEKGFLLGADFIEIWGKDYPNL